MGMRQIPNEMKRSIHECSAALTGSAFAATGTTASVEGLKMARQSRSTPPILKMVRTFSVPALVLIPSRLSQKKIRISPAAMNTLFVSRSVSVGENKTPPIYSEPIKGTAATDAALDTRVVQLSTNANEG